MADTHPRSSALYSPIGNPRAVSGSAAQSGTVRSRRRPRCRFGNRRAASCPSRCTTGLPVLCSCWVQQRPRSRSISLCLGLFGLPRPAEQQIDTGAAKVGDQQHAAVTATEILAAQAPTGERLGPVLHREFGCQDRQGCDSRRHVTPRAAVAVPVWQQIPKKPHIFSAPLQRRCGTVIVAPLSGAILAADARAVLLLLLTGRRALVRRFSCLPLAGDGITLRRGLWNQRFQTVAGRTARAGERMRSRCACRPPAAAGPERWPCRAGPGEPVDAQSCRRHCRSQIAATAMPP